jgi:signal transduction histidine kinase
MKRRLFLQFYVTIIISLGLLVAAAGLMWRVVQNTSPARSAFDFAGELAGAVLPPATSPVPEQQAALDKFAASLRTDLALFGMDRVPIAAAGQPLPPPQDWQDSGGRVHVPGGHAWAIALPDGRWLVMRSPRDHGGRLHPALGLVGVLGGIALAVAIGAYPIVRGLTRRLERLQEGVVSLGEGDLSTRVKVEGRDEVAALAQSFNRSAERVEALVGAHRLLLANASHELRTPLSRIRLGVELLKDGPDTQREANLVKDIAELDQLVDEILLSSRLDATSQLDTRDAVDLLGLAAEECARYPGCALNGEAATVRGDPRLIRRLIRNLLENAARHGKPPIEVCVRAQGGEAVIIVADHGSGIPAAEHDMVFEPFHRAPSRTAGGGTGLGLTLVRQIARRHGGDAHYETTGPTGSQFRVTLQT